MTTQWKWGCEKTIVAWNLKEVKVGGVSVCKFIGYFRPSFFIEQRLVSYLYTYKLVMYYFYDRGIEN